MHIAIDARIINSSTGRYVERLVYYLQEVDTKNQYTILVPTKDIDFFKPTNKNFTVKPIDFANYSLAEQIKFKAYLEELAPDLVHFCMPQQPVLYKGRHVTTVHDLNLFKTYNSDKNWFMYHAKQFVGRFVFKYVGKTSQHVIATSRYTKDEYLRFAHIPSEKVSVVYESADVFVDKLTPYKHPFKEFIMYVGQQSDYKNIKRLGDAHQQLLETRPDLGLILVGRKNAAAKKNEAYFQQKGYKNILFTDFVEDAQRDWLYTQAAAYVFPSLMEGFGLPALEAMGYGTPVASSNATCLPEIYGDAAHYFVPTDTRDIARAINDILTNPDLRESLIEKGSQQIKKYSWRKMAKQTHAIYMNAITSSSEQ